MAASALYLKDPATTRFLSGGRAEAESLLGAPLPPLPDADYEKGRAVFSVKFHPELRKLLVRYLQAVLREIGADMGPEAPRNKDSGKEQSEYEAALERMLRSVRLTDRRHGLLNLCWLAHSREVAEGLKEIEARVPAVKKLKYSLHPLLSSFHKRLDQSVRRALEQQDPLRYAFLTGGRENTALQEALFDDGFAFTEHNIVDFDFNNFLASNKRYRLPSDVFFEVYSILYKETERRLREGDRGLLARVTRHMNLPKEQLQTQAGVVKVMMNAHVITYLLGDAWGTGSRLLASPRLKQEAERRRPAEILDVYNDLITGLKRFELVAHVRDKVTLVRGFGEGGADEGMTKRRVFEFGDAAQVLNNAVSATVLFLDLRGFTQTSEGHISERDLTQELYTVFDAFVPHVRRFGGTVDKFLGDGIMVTYGTTRVDPLDPLNAVRTAVLCQETLHRLRREGKTYFKMGVAIHYGRVYIARFLADEESVQTTVIGRNVNLSGRLSSAAKKPIDEDEPEPEPQAPPPEFHVTIDESGTLFNEGIAISRDALLQLEAHLPLVHAEGKETRHMEYFDDQIGRRLLIRYAGDAKFKGVRSSFPCYEVDFVH